LGQEDEARGCQNGHVRDPLGGYDLPCNSHVPTQSVLNHAVAGIFIAISRPFKHGDEVTIAGKTGTVKEITVMHTTIISTDGEQEILILSGTIIGEIITKSLSPNHNRGLSVKSLTDYRHLNVGNVSRY